MRRDAADQTVDADGSSGSQLSQPRRRKAGNGRAEEMVFVGKQPEIALPSFAREVIKPRKPVAPLQRERTALKPKDAAAHRIFPVGAMNFQLPDVVAPLVRTPSRLRR